MLRCVRRWIFTAATLSLLTSGCGSAETTQTDRAPLELRAPTLAEAFVDLPRNRPLAVSLETDLGTLHCEVDPTAAPRAVALFVGLALGRATFLDPKTHKPVQRALYRDLAFHRAVAGMLIQTGDPVGDSSGNPGYRIAVETNATDSARLSQPGALVLARYTPPPGRRDPHPPLPGMVLGSQFAVLLSAMPHLASQVSVLGRCRDLELAQTIADDIANRHTPHRLQRVTIP